MATNREVAWHQFGKDLIGSTSVAEALRKAELDFTVDKKKLYDENGNEIPGWFRNVRSDVGNVLGIVTGKYNIVQNEDAFDFVNNIIGSGIEFEKGGTFHQGKAVWVEAKLPGEYKICGDSVDSHIVFINSHDGKGAVKACMVPNRLACSNQINHALKTATRSWSIIHSSKVDTRIAEARESLGLADTYMKALVTESELLAKQKMDDQEFIDIINKIYPIDEINDSNRKKTNVAEIKHGLLECLKADDLANFRGTKLEKVFAVSDFVDHRESQRNTANFGEARWEKIANGHPDVDKFYQAIIAA